MKSLLFALGLLSLSSSANLRAAEDLPRVQATEEKAIRDLVGKKATVSGRVIAAKEAKNGMTFLDFEGGKFTVVAWKEDYAKFEGGSPAKLYAKKVIEVTGTIIDYKAKTAKPDAPGKLEIKLNSPEQVKIAKDSDSAEKDPKAPTDNPGRKGAAKKESSETPAVPDQKKDPETAAGGKSSPVAAENPPERVDAKKYFK